MIRYVVTLHSGGANLSKPGHWGNLPYPNPEAAERAARVDAHPDQYSIETERSRR